MLTKPCLRPILDNEALTRGLGDPEARALVEWLVGEAEILAEQAVNRDHLAEKVERLCRHARSIARFVHLWCYKCSRAAACQLAATERFAWPLPATAMDPFDLMEDILRYEVDLAEAAI
jgi:hypothetical protein